MEFAFFCLLIVVGASSTPITVDLSAGKVQGEVVDGVATFRGIPYAEAPVGNLRWRDPIPKAPWSNVLSAIEDGPGCPQECKLPNATCPPKQDEDCLFLNVFAPAPKAGTVPKAVLFWIHGGNFYQGYGGGILYDGSHMVLYLVFDAVVLVVLVAGCW